LFIPFPLFSFGLYQLNDEQFTASVAILAEADGSGKQQIDGYWNQSLGRIKGPPIGGWLD